MKKLIAIAVVFVLAVGAAFAADISADLFGHIDLVSGTGVKDTDLNAGGGWGRTQFGASAQNDEGTFGGWFRLRADGYGAGSGATWGNAWWKPIPQLQFLIGGNNDGLFGADGIGRWGFYQVAGDVIIPAGNAWGGGNEAEQAGWPMTFSRIFYGGWDTAGAVITITPTDALTVNIAVPFFDGGTGEQIYKKTAAQVAYNIDGIGKVALTWDKYEADGNGGDNLGELFFYFNLTAVENLSVDFGIGLPLKQSDKIADKDLTYFDLALGLGVTYNAGAFGVKARFGTEFASQSYDGKTASDGVPIIFDVMPYYALTDNLTANLSIGLGGRGEGKDSDGNKTTDATEIAWHVYPYVTVKGGWWAPNLYAGLLLEGAGNRLNANDKGEPDSSNPIIKWSVPIGIAFSF